MRTLKLTPHAVLFLVAVTVGGSFLEALPVAPVVSSLPAAEGDAEAPAGEVFEEIDVREGETLLDLPPKLGRLGRIDADDFLVRVGGETRTPVKLERLGAGEAHLALYFDLTAPDPRPAQLAALTLADRADTLAGMGSVEVVVADPEPEVLQPPTRDRYLLEAALAEVAARQRRRSRPAFTVHGGADPERWNGVVEWAEASKASGPRFLFLVIEGFQPEPEEVAALAGGRSGEALAATPAEGPEVSARVARVRRAARALAAVGWVTVPVVLSEDDLAPQVARPIEVKDWRGETAYGIDFLPVASMLWRKLRGRSGAPPPDDEEEYRTHTTPVNLPLLVLVRETGGEIVGHTDLLDRTLDDLKDRWRLWYPAEAPGGGAPRRLEVIYAEDGRRMHGRRWVAGE